MNIKKIHPKLKGCQEAIKRKCFMAAKIFKLSHSMHIKMKVPDT